MTLKEDLENVSHVIGYLYAPGSHHVTTRVIPAARLFSDGRKVLHKKSVLERKTEELQKTKHKILEEHIPRSKDMKLSDVRLEYNLPFLHRRDLKIHDTLMAREFTKVRSVIIWNFRAILDRIGELDVEEMKTQVHQIYFASNQMDVLFDIYQTYVDLYGKQSSGVFDAIRRISKWIHDRYSTLEQHLEVAEHATFHAWRSNKNYKLLKSFLLKKYVGSHTKKEQLVYLDQIISNNEHL